ncbi:MAG: 3-oxoacyl-ACP reductase [Ponticaulis sp.]|nr:3-oxoacyl-ACP reductase [Ponticaulis sp.]
MPSILITGASSGIGRATALRFLEEGWTVGLLARREDKLVELAGDHANARIIVCDVTDFEEVDRAFDWFAGEAGRIDVLFNNAGRGAMPATIDEMSPETWLSVVNVNLNGMFWCARAAFRHMRAQSPQGGRIINNGSISATTPRPGATPYNATKHAITGLTKSLALDGRPFTIACGQIDIGNAATDMTVRMAKGITQADGSVKSEPTMDVQEVANAVMHMANLPLEANILSMTVMATNMPFVGRG